MLEAQRRQPQPMEKVDFLGMGRIGRTDHLEHLVFGSAVAEIRDRPVVEAAAFVTFAADGFELEIAGSKRDRRPHHQAVACFEHQHGLARDAVPFEQRAMRRGAVMQAGMNHRDVELMSP
jgi:hypothetical protein